MMLAFPYRFLTWPHWMVERWFSEGIDRTLYSGKSGSVRKNQEVKEQRWQPFAVNVTKFCLKCIPCWSWQNAI